MLLNQVAVLSESLFRLALIQFGKLVFPLPRQFVDFLVHRFQMMEEWKVVGAGDTVALERIILQEDRLSFQLRLCAECCSETTKNY